MSKSMVDQFKDKEHKMLCMLSESNAERLDRLNGRVFRVIMSLVIVTGGSAVGLIALVVKLAG